MPNLIDKVKDKLKELNIKYESVSLSNRPDKKIKIIINGKTIHFWKVLVRENEMLIKLELAKLKIKMVNILIQ